MQCRFCGLEVGGCDVRSQHFQPGYPGSSGHDVCRINAIVPRGCEWICFKVIQINCGKRCRAAYRSARIRDDDNG